MSRRNFRLNRATVKPTWECRSVNIPTMAGLGNSSMTRPTTSRCQPTLDVRPRLLVRGTAGHDSDVSAGYREQFFILAAGLCHDGLRLTWWRDVVPFGDDREKPGPDAT